MAQVDTNFPKVRRMPFYVSPLIFGHFWPASTLLHGHIALAIPSLLETDPQILGIGVALMKITWANHSKRWIFVSNVSMTYHGFSESNTSDWFPYVWALPQNRWRLRRLHILRYATQLACNFQHSHCTFVTILFRPFASQFINLAMRIRALFLKSASILGLVEQAFGEMPFFTEWIGASSFEVILARQSSHFPTWASFL